MWTAKILMAVSLFAAIAVAGPGFAMDQCPMIVAGEIVEPVTSAQPTYPLHWIQFSQLSFDGIYTDKENIPYFSRSSQVMDLVTELQNAIRTGKVKMDFSGRPRIRYYESVGSPHYYTYDLARRIERNIDWAGARFEQSISTLVKQVLDEFLAGKKTSYQEMWASPHYAQLEQIQISEHKINVWEGKKGSARKMVSEEWWNNRNLPVMTAWWLSSSRFESHITSKTSLSPLRKMENAYRQTWWMVEGSYGSRVLDFSRVRVSESLLPDPEYPTEKGRRLGVELNINKAINEPPIGFYFNDFQGELVPALKFKSLTSAMEPIEIACKRCHSDASGRATFTPKQLTTFDHWKAVGYGEKVIPDLIKAGN